MAVFFVTTQKALMQHYTKAVIAEWERFYRANFINSLSGFKSASLIGTVNNDGNTNLAIFSNIIHLGANPALIAFQNRPLEAGSHTLSNIQATGSYTINHIPAQYSEQAHQTSAKYLANVSEFKETGFTEQWVDGIKAPFVEQSLIKYALILQEIIPITQNNTFLVIGEIVHVIVAENLIEQDGFIEADKAGSITSLGVDGYYSVKKIARYNYAKPNVALAHPLT